jgi:hypothetical protein
VALSDDQKAILRLLAQRGAAGYEDLSALLGISVAEVHKRAQKAAEELEADGIPAPSIPEPGGEASPTTPPPPAAEKPRALPKGKPKPPLKKELKLLEGRGLWAILAGVAIVVLFVIFILVSGGGDDDSSGSSASAPADSCKVGKAPEATGKNVEALAIAAVKTGKNVTRAVLNPVDGSEAKGLAVFGRVKNSLALQVAAEGLPASGECGYTIWLAASEDKMLPLASTKVVKNGAINAQVEVPVEVLAYLANETFGQLAVTRTDESQLKASLAQATKEKKAPVYTGTEVLRGSIRGPIVGAAKRIEEQKQNGK